MCSLYLKIFILPVLKSIKQPFSPNTLESSGHFWKIHLHFQATRISNKQIVIFLMKLKPSVLKNANTPLPYLICERILESQKFKYLSFASVFLENKYKPSMKELPTAQLSPGWAWYSSSCGAQHLRQEKLFH